MKYKQSIKKLFATAEMCAVKIFDGNFLLVFAGYVTRFLKLVVILAVFRSLPDYSGMNHSQMMTYALISSVFAEQLYIFTPATTALWEGSIINRFTRPLPVIGELIAETVGKWAPSLVFYSLPICVAAAFSGRILLPNFWGGLFFLLSLLLGISLGFAVDIIFSGFAMRLKNGCWAALAIREALTSLFSGALIPFAMLPKLAGNILSMLPLGSLAGAPLSIYVGMGNPFWLIGLSLFWNAVLWPVCVIFFRKSQERMVSYGG